MRRDEGPHPIGCELRAHYPAEHEDCIVGGLLLLILGRSVSSCDALLLLALAFIRIEEARRLTWLINDEVTVPARPSLIAWVRVHQNSSSSECASCSLVKSSGSNAVTVTSTRGLSLSSCRV